MREGKEGLRIEVYEDYDEHGEERWWRKGEKKMCSWFTVTYDIPIWSSHSLSEKNIKGLKFKN